jgi:hypothetical protein
MDFGAMDFVFGGGLLGIASACESSLDSIVSSAAKIVLRRLEFEGEIRPGLPATVNSLLGTFEWIFHERNMRPFGGRSHVQTSKLSS